MPGKQNGYCLHLDDGKWVRPPAFSTAEHRKVQSSQLEEVQVGLLAVLAGQGAAVQVTWMPR